MTSLLQLKGNEKVLEIGTGSGYQAAILSSLAKRVYTIERIPELTQKAQAILSKLNCTNVTVIIGNGIRGLPCKAPFDAIIVTASGPQVPKPLLAQLKDRGRIVIPIVEKDGDEKLKIGIKKNKHTKFSDAGSVRFVPLIDKNGFPLEVKK